MTPIEAIFLIGVWLIAQDVGDYIAQSDWQANVKTKSSVPAAVHALLYTACHLPILYVTGATAKVGIALLIIGGTHFLIDRYRLARFVCWAKNFLGPDYTDIDGEPETKITPLRPGQSIRYDSNGLCVVSEESKPDVHYRISYSMGEGICGYRVNRWIHEWQDCKGTGYHKDVPPFMSVWLMIKADNTMHKTINFAALLWAVC